MCTNIVYSELERISVKFLFYFSVDSTKSKFWLAWFMGWLELNFFFSFFLFCSNATLLIKQHTHSLCERKGEKRTQCVCVCKWQKKKEKQEWLQLLHTTNENGWPCIEIRLKDMHILRSNWNENACQITVCVHQKRTKKKKSRGIKITHKS